MIRRPAVALAAVLALATPLAAAPPGALRIVSFNLLHGGFHVLGGGDGERLEERLAMTIDELRRLDPDVIGLQEASAGRTHGDVAARVASALGFHHVRAPAGYRWIGRLVALWTGMDEGPAIVSRFPIVSSETFSLAPCNAWYGRSVVCAVLATPDGEVDTCSTHTAGSACQLRSLAARLRERRSGRPLVLLGDLNSPPDARGIGELRSALGLVDAFPAVHRDDPGFTVWQPVREPNRNARRRVDYVLLAAPRRESIRVLDGDVVLDVPHRAADGRPLWPSDHYGVLVDADLFQSASR